MKALVMALLICHAIPIIGSELILFEYPFKSVRRKSFFLVLGTIINLSLNAFILYLIRFRFFGSMLLSEIPNLLSLNCSYQEIGRLASSCLMYLAVFAVIACVQGAVTRRFVNIEKFRTDRFLILLTVAAMIPILFGYQFMLSGAKTVLICAFCRETAYTGGEGTDTDRNASYVTIRNEGVLPYELPEAYLSDTEEDLPVFLLNAGTLAPGEEATTWLIGNHKPDIGEKDSAMLYFSDAKGDLLDTISVPVLARNEVYIKQREEWQIVIRPVTEETVSVPEPQFSAESGFYQDDFYLVLYSEEGMEVHYTLDCSSPTVESMLYRDPIYIYDRSSDKNQYRSVRNVRSDYVNEEEPAMEPVEKAFVVRAVAVDSAGNASSVVTKTYFIGREEPDQEMVVSLVLDPEDLFGGDGIYVTGKEYDDWVQEHLEEIRNLPESVAQRLKDEDGNVIPSVWDEAPALNYERRGDERQGNFEIIRNGSVLLNQETGIRISGATSRKKLLKRFSVFSRKEYSGSKCFSTPIFDGILSHSVALRDGFLNSFIPDLVRDRNVAILRSIPVRVFLDGEFWYDTYLCEKYNHTYFSEHYGLELNNIDYVKVTWWNRMSDEEREIYNREIVKPLKELDLSSPEDYSIFCKSFDVQSYIDFTCINIYVNNEDTTDKVNCLLWKTGLKENDEAGDGRWRWGLFDMDLQWGHFRRTLGLKHDYEVNTFTACHKASRKSAIEQPIYSALRKSETFCRQFVLTFMDLVNSNFRTEHVLECLEAWGNKDAAIERFFTERAQWIIPYLAEEFKLTGSTENVTLTSTRAGMPVAVNTIIPVLNECPWTGLYFTDYPITIAALDADFDHWEITENGQTNICDEISMEVPVAKGGVQIHAVFK